jgi:replicative DNA helicase
MYDAENLRVAIDSGVTPNWFYAAEHQEIFTSLLGLADSKDWNHASNFNVLDSAGLFRKHEAALDIFGAVPEWAFNIDEMETAIEQLRSLHTLENINHILSTARAQVIEGVEPAEIVACTQAELERIAELSEGPNERTTQQIAADAYAMDEKIYAGATVGLPFPWLGFQAKTYGLPFKAVTPLAGRDGAGKSRLAAYLTEFWCRQGIPILYFPFEDQAERAIGNIAATHGGYDAFRIKSGAANDEFMTNHRNTLQKVGDWPLFIEDASMTPEHLVSVIARHKRKYGIRGVVIDWVKDLIIDGRESLVEREGRMMATLVRAAKKYDVAILAVMHLRDVPNDQWIKKADIRGSKTLTQSSRMTLMYQDKGIQPALLTRYNIRGDDEIILDCQKCSYGNRTALALRPELHRGTFVEIPPSDY